MAYKTDFSKIDLDKYFFDDKTANTVVRYIEENVKHVKGDLAGKPFILEEWQKNDIIRPLFGWKHIDTGLRKYTSAYIEIPKKSGKSFLAASVACIFIDIEREGGSEIVGVAWGRKQAGLVFEATKQVIQKSPRLKSKCNIYRNSITAPDHIGGLKTYQILSKEAGGEDGINPQLAIIDELHVHKNNEVLEMVEKSQGARKQPLSFIITTAGSDLYGIGYQRHENAINVAKGVTTDESQLVCVYGADYEDDPFKEETWIKANPNYNISIGQRAYEKEAAKAMVSASSLNSFKRYYLNIWTQSKDGWINDEIWNASQWEMDESILKDYPCYGGLDLSSRSDITAFSLVWQIDDKFFSKNWFWLPEDKGTQSADTNNIQYREWVRDGHIEETSGNVVDYDFIIYKLGELNKLYQIKSIAYDNWNSHHIAPRLMDEGLDLIEFRQGFKSMNAPTKEMQAAIESRKFNHFGNPVLRWMAGNASVKSDPAGNIKLEKDFKAPSKKIDGLISNVMAYGLWLDNPEDTNSYLEQGNLYII
jgi:phage terminase large subunit-like protein